MSDGRDDDLRIRPGKPRDRGSRGPAKRFVNQVRRAAKAAGHTGRGFGPQRSTVGRRFGRGQAATGRFRRTRTTRRVIVKARLVRHTGQRFRAAPLARHIAYLEREGVARDSAPARMFDARSDQASGEAFAARCEGDRHHFRFIVSPEDAGELADLRSYARDLMGEMARDLGTSLDWVAVDHWNTDNPHLHILVRGVDSQGADLVIARDYIKQGLRDAAEHLATLELGPRSERDISASLQRDVDAERWTGLDRDLLRAADRDGQIDLRPPVQAADPDHHRRLVGRAQKLERLGLATATGPAQWTLQPGAEVALRDLGIRNDIIKTMHRAMAGAGRAPDPAAFALHGDGGADPVLGRLVERGLHDELSGTAYAVVDGVDGRTHHLRFSDLELTGDSAPGAIVELRTWQDAKGVERRALAIRSDLPIERQVDAPGATWLDRQLVAREPAVAGGGFGAEVRGAMAARADHLVGEGLATRRGRQVILARNLLATLSRREFDAAAQAIADRTGLAHRPVAVGDQVAGIYRERISLATGRFAMIDDGMGFQLVPWRPALEQQLGRHVSGTLAAGGVDWTFARQRGLGR